MRILRNLSKPLVLMPIGGGIYYLIETIWRGHSHWTMLIVGGLCFYLIGLINEVLPWELGFVWQCLIAAGVITLVELTAGYIINIRLGWGIWDYSHLPGNFMGQICLPYSLLWVLLSGVGICLDDWLRYFLYGEVRPKYKLF